MAAGRNDSGCLRVRLPNPMVSPRVACCHACERDRTPSARRRDYFPDLSGRSQSSRASSRSRPQLRPTSASTDVKLISSNLSLSLSLSLSLFRYEFSSFPFAWDSRALFTAHRRSLRRRHHDRSERSWFFAQRQGIGKSLRKSVGHGLALANKVLGGRRRPPKIEPNSREEDDHHPSPCTLIPRTRGRFSSPDDLCVRCDTLLGSTRIDPDRPIDRPSASLARRSFLRTPVVSRPASLVLLSFGTLVAIGYRERALDGQTATRGRTSTRLG